MRIIATADIHNKIPEFPDDLRADVLVVAGDLTGTHRYDYRGQASFINRQFVSFCERIKRNGVVKHVVVCAGNHDLVWEDELHLIHLTDSFVYLRDSGVTLDGVSFWGTPWTIPFNGWAFNAREEVRELAFSQIPQGIDVLLSHGPPTIGGLGYLEDKQLGDPVLTKHIHRAKPGMVFCGHIHYSSGQCYQVDHGDGKTTKMYNVAYLGEDYKRIPGGGYAVVEI